MYQYIARTPLSYWNRFNFLSHPRYVVTDSKGRIVIADLGQKKLLVFNRRGKLLYTIGRKGPGPREFHSIKGMTIDPGNVITVFDELAQAFKKFSSSGKYLRPVFLHFYSKNYRLIGNNIPLLKFKGINRGILPPFMSNGSKNHFIIGNTLYLTPNLFNGYIYKYLLSDEKQGIGMQLIGKYQGLIHYAKPAEVFNNKQLTYANDQMTTRWGKHYQYLIHNQSKGLFRLKNGDIVHFTYIESKHPHKRVFGIELYNSDMTPIGYSPLKR